MIIIVEDFEEVILQQLQLKLDSGVEPILKWWDLWFAAAEAAKKFMAPVDAATNRKKFVARMVKAIDLLERIDYIEVNRSPSRRIMSLKLRERGIEKLNWARFISK